MNAMTTTRRWLNPFIPRNLESMRPAISTAPGGTAEAVLPETICETGLSHPSFLLIIVFGWSLLCWLRLCRLGLSLPVFILGFFVACLTLALGLHRGHRTGLRMRPPWLRRRRLRTRLRRRFR